MEEKAEGKCFGALSRIIPHLWVFSTFFTVQLHICTGLLKISFSFLSWQGCLCISVNTGPSIQTVFPTLLSLSCQHWFKVESLAALMVSFERCWEVCPRQKHYFVGFHRDSFLWVKALSLDSIQYMVDRMCVLVTQSCPPLCNPMDCSLYRLLCPWNSPGKNMEWVAIPFLGGSSWPRDRIQVSCIEGRFFTI